MALVSIVVPIYNQEDYLRHCVDSLLMQTLSDLEIILVDDGSTDRSPGICDQYARQDKRVKVIHKVNGGLSDARNTGIDIASGKYLAFVDSDDFVDVEMYEKLLYTLKKAEADIVVCGCKRVDEQGNLLPPDNIECSLPELVCEGRSVLNGEALENRYYWLTVVAWNKLYKREIFEHLRYPKGKYHEDEFVFHELYAKVKNAAFISEKMYYYRKREGSIVGIEKPSYRLDREEAFYHRIRFCLNEGFQNAVSFYEKIMFMDLEMVFREKDFCIVNRERVDVAKRMDKEIVEMLYRLHLISFGMWIDRMFFFKSPKVFFSWKIVCNKMKRECRKILFLSGSEKK